MNLDGDDVGDMMATPPIHDAVIEALIRGETVHDAHARLAAFAHEVRAVGAEPVPRPSTELAALLQGGVRPRRGSFGAVGAVCVVGRRSPSGRTEGNRMRGSSRVEGTTRSTAGLGLAAKIGLGTSLAVVGLGSAAAAGVLPAAANDAVRDAIEVVSPVEFDRQGDDRSDFGDRVSDDATGASDGVNGVDGPQIADDAPGAAHRSGPGVDSEAPGRPGKTGLTRANETPAAPHAPEVPPSTVPARGGDSTPGPPVDPGPPGDGDTPGPPDDPGQGDPPESVPSTVPERGRP